MEKCKREMSNAERNADDDVRTVNEHLTDEEEFKDERNERNKD